MARETWVQSQWYLMPSCLTLGIIRYGLRVKCSNPGEGLTPPSTPIKKEAFGSSSTTVAKLTYLYDVNKIVEKVPAVVGSIVVVGTRTRCASLYSLCDLKVAQMNRNLCFTGSNWARTAWTQPITFFCAKSESTVDHRTINRWLKEISLETIDSVGSTKRYQASPVSQSSDCFFISTTWPKASESA